MSSYRVAVKKLTHSDLTFFEEYFRRDSSSKQKAINLNSAVFVESFYPGLRNHSEEIPLLLEVIGPGGGLPNRLSRKATRSPGSKNWRLNGELVYAPQDEPQKYSPLAPDDVAFLAFEGEVRPAVVRMVLVSQSQDPELHAAVTAGVPLKDRLSMVALTRAQVDELLVSTGAAYSGLHPLACLAGTDSEVTAVLGNGYSQEESAASDGRGVAVSRDSVRRQVEAAAETGHAGEQAFASWLGRKGLSEEEYEWISLGHARSCYDFVLNRAPWPAGAGPIFVDVKTTSAGAEARFFMSLAELRWASKTASYRIARIARIGDRKIQLMILSGVHELSAKGLPLLEGARSLGVSPISFEVDPAVLSVDFHEEFLVDEEGSTEDP